MIERIGVVANAHSLFHGSKKNLGDPVSYPLLMGAITNERRLLEATACVQARAGQQRFLESLTIAKMRYLVCETEDELTDKFAFEMIRIAPMVDTLVIATGDHSVLSIIDYLEETKRKPNVELWFFEQDVDRDLREGVDTVRHITQEMIYQSTQQ